MSKINKIRVNNVDYEVEDTTKQPVLVAGENIKTINGNSLLGEGNLEIDTKTTETDIANMGFTKNTGTVTGIKMNDEQITGEGVIDLGDVVTEHQSIKTINNLSLIGTGNIEISSGDSSPFKKDLDFGMPSPKYYNGLQETYNPEGDTKEITEKNIILGYLDKPGTTATGTVVIDNDGATLIFYVTAGRTYTITTNWSTAFTKTSHCKWGKVSSLSPSNGDTWTGHDNEPVWSNLKTFSILADFTGYCAFQLYSSLQSGLTTDNFTVIETSSNFNQGTTYEEMITAFDNLLSKYPNYISKTQLGLCSDNSQYLYEYDFNPFSMTYTNRSSAGKSVTGNKIPPMKILVIGGQHGYEKASIFGLYYFLKDMCENWEDDEVLDYMRHSVVFKVIPVCNPYGWDNFEYLNANSVNLNRNYDMPDFDPSSTGTQYGGLEPFDQPETQLIRDFVNANLDAMFFIDFHTEGNTIATGFDQVNWIDTIPNQDSYFEYILKCCHTFFDREKAHFNKDYELGLTDTDTFGTLTNGNSQFNEDFPSADAWATSKNLIGLTLEGFNGFPNDAEMYLSNCLKANSEIFGNFVNTIINMYNKK